MKVSTNKEGLTEDGFFVYTPSNVLVTDEKHVEVVKGWQWFDGKFDNTWECALDEDYIRYKSFSEYQHANDLCQKLTRQVYITIPPTEKLSLADEVGRNENMPDIANYIYSKVPTPEDIEWAKGKVQQIKSSIPEAQPLEGVKTAEEQAAIRYPLDEEWSEIDKYIVHSKRHGFVQGFAARNAQFATDAGGGKENPYTNIPCHKCNQNSDSMQSCTCTKFEEFEEIKKNNAPAKTALQVLSEYSWDIRDEVLQAMQDYADQFKALSAPSTHSSSEMVEERPKQDWTQQDLTFKVSELLEHSFDIKYARTDSLLNAYQIESSLHSIIESLGLELVITDRSKFECNLGGPLDL